MKIAILNLSNNVSDFKTVSSAETILIGRSLTELGHSVDIISMRNTEYTISFDVVTDINSYDRLIVINGTINFFGGKKNPIVLNSYKLMAEYRNKIYYIFTDGRLGFMQVLPAVRGKEFSSEYKDEDLFVSSDFKVISQGRNLEIAKKAHKKTTERYGKEFEYDYFPVDRYFIHSQELKPANQTIKKYDVVYCGSFRAGKRESKMVEFLFDTNLNIKMFGTIKEKKFKNPKFPWNVAPSFSPKIASNLVIDTNSQAIATIVIGDKDYNDNFITVRVWEAMASDAVMLIDEEFDSEHLIIDDPRFYVKNKNDFETLVNELKTNECLRRELITIQHQTLFKYQSLKSEWQKELLRVLDITA